MNRWVSSLNRSLVHCITAAARARANPNRRSLLPVITALTLVKKTRENVILNMTFVKYDVPINAGRIISARREKNRIQYLLFCNHASMIFIFEGIKVAQIYARNLLS
jgi:hypothetical protein